MTLPSTERIKTGFFYGYVVVSAAFLVMVIMWGMFSSFGVFLKPLSTEFGWTRAMTSTAYSLSFIIFGLCSIATGKLSDRFGPRIILTVCGLLLGSGYLFVSQTGTIWQLYLSYSVIGAGMSGTTVPLASMVARWFTQNRGMMIGILFAGIGTGMLIMPPVVTWLIINYGWRTTYIVVGVTILVLVVPLAQFLRRDPSQIGQLPYGDRELKKKGDIYDAGFSLQEGIHTPQFWMFGGTLFFFALIVGTVLVHVIPYAISSGLSAPGAAVVLSVVGIFGTGSRIIVGITGDRIGYKPTFIICFILVSISPLLLLAAKDLWMFYLFATIFGIGHGGVSSLMSPMVVELFGLSSLGVIFGVITIGGIIGMAIGPIVAGHIFDTMGSYNLAFIIYAGISVIGLILVSLLKPTAGKL